MGRKISVYDKLTIQLTYALVYERLTDGMLPSCPLVTDERYVVSTLLWDLGEAIKEIDESYASDPQFSDPIEGPERKAMELHRFGTITLGRGRK